MFDLLRLAFGQPIRPAKPLDAIDDATVRAVVAQHSHGNVRLQDGRYYTREDIDAEYNALRGVELTA